eukprot:2974170-Pyramimonas_sp.AAC.1
MNELPEMRSGEHRLGMGVFTEGCAECARRRLPGAGRARSRLPSAARPTDETTGRAPRTETRAGPCGNLRKVRQYQGSAGVD